MEPSERRIAEAENLFLESETMGSVDLVALSDDSECFLGEGLWPLSDPRVFLAWSALQPDERDRRRQIGLAELLAGGLAEVRDTSDTQDLAGVDLDARLALVALAREAPSFVVNVVPPVDSRGLVIPFGYGIVEEGLGLRAVLIEVRDGSMHQYRLASARQAAHGIAEWTRLALTSNEVGTRCTEVVIEVGRHREGEGLEMAIVRVAGPDSQDAGGAITFDGERVVFQPERTDVLADLIGELIGQASEFPRVTEYR